MAAIAKLTHNPDGTVATSTDPRNHVTTYGYNGVHQLTSVTPPAGNSLRARSFTYDGYGRLKTLASGRGITTTYTYDASDRLKTETHSDNSPSLSYTYDAAGNQKSRVDASGTTTYDYDAANRLLRKTPPGGAALSYTYDPVGNLATATDAGGTTSYHYDKANLLHQITEPGGRIDVFAYDADHRRTDTWYAAAYPGGGGVRYDASGNNVVAPSGFAAHIRASFDNAGHLTRLRTTRASSDADANRVADLSYAYTVAAGTTCAGMTPGRATDLRQSATNHVTASTTSYCYDGGARLTRASTPGGATFAYGYDPSGNRTAGPEGNHTYNSANQATDMASTYNAEGGLTASTAFPALAYNGIDQTTSITAQGQGAMPLAYAGATQDERASAGPSTYQNGLLGVQSKATTSCPLLLCSTTTSFFIRDPQGTLVTERIGAEQYYYVFDGLGSIIALVDASGNQRAAYTYDPYGANATATALNGALPDNPFRFAGGYLDTTGLYHFGARYYDAKLGRWTQQDSVVSLGDPANGNRYAYAGDNPVNFIDPAGREFLGIDCPLGEYDDGGCVGGSVDEAETYIAQGAGYLIGATVTATCGAAVIGFTGGIGTPGTVTCLAAGRVAGQATAYAIREGE